MPFTIIIALVVLGTAFLGSCVASTGLDVDAAIHSNSHLRRRKDNIVGRRMPQQVAAAAFDGRKLEAECALFLQELCVSGAHDENSLDLNPGLEVKLKVYHRVDGWARGLEELTDGYEDLDKPSWCININKSVYPLEGGSIKVEVWEHDWPSPYVDKYKAEFSDMCKSVLCERKGVRRFSSTGGTFSLKFSTPVPPDKDNDGTPDCKDECPDDPYKTEPGECGCGTPDVDSDNDGTPDCNDKCPFDPTKISDIDSDNDGTLDCNDKCPFDPNKTTDDDSDNDGTLDCNDKCPDDPNKTEPGVNGCGNPDPDPISDDSAGLSTGLLVSGIVGGVFVLVALILGALAYRRASRKREIAPQPISGNSTTENPAATTSPVSPLPVADCVLVPECPLPEPMLPPKNPAATTLDSAGKEIDGKDKMENPAATAPCSREVEIDLSDPMENPATATTNAEF